MVRICSFISRARAYACMCGQARNRRLTVKNNIYLMSKTTKKVETESHVKPEMYQDIFAIVKNGDNYYIGVAGKLVVPKSFATSEEAKQYVDAKPWDLIINTTCLCMDLSNNKK